MEFIEHLQLRRRRLLLLLLAVMFDEDEVDEDGVVEEVNGIARVLEVEGKATSDVERHSDAIFLPPGIELLQKPNRLSTNRVFFLSYIRKPWPSQFFLFFNFLISNFLW